MQAATAQDYKIETITQERAAVKYIFYPGNLMPAVMRSADADWRLGGRLRYDIATLNHRNNYIRQCEITDCRQQMIPTWINNIIPGERKHKPNAYKLTVNGETKIIGRQSADETAAFLFTPWYPEQDLARVVAQNEGIVYMPVTSEEERIAAQYFLFPNWDRVLSGQDKLPTLIADLRAHFVSREVAAQDALMKSVATAAIRACDTFEAAGNERIATDNAIYDMAKTKGHPWSYGQDAVLYMEQLGVARRDNLADQATSDVNKLASILSEAFSRGLLTAPQPQPAPVIENNVFEEQQAAAVPEPDIAPEPERVTPVLVPEIEEEPAVADMPPTGFEPKIGGIAIFNGNTGTITAVTKKKVVLEMADGEGLTAPIEEIIVISEPVED